MPDTTERSKPERKTIPEIISQSRSEWMAIASQEYDRITEPYMNIISQLQAELIEAKGIKKA